MTRFQTRSKDGAVLVGPAALVLRPRVLHRPLLRLLLLGKFLRHFLIDIRLSVLVKLHVLIVGPLVFRARVGALRTSQIFTSFGRRRRLHVLLIGHSLHGVVSLPLELGVEQIALDELITIRAERLDGFFVKLFEDLIDVAEVGLRCFRIVAKLEGLTDNLHFLEGISESRQLVSDLSEEFGVSR